MSKTGHKKKVKSRSTSGADPSTQHLDTARQISQRQKLDEFLAVDGTVEVGPETAYYLVRLAEMLAIDAAYELIEEGCEIGIEQHGAGPDFHIHYSDGSLHLACMMFNSKTDLIEARATTSEIVSFTEQTEIIAQSVIAVFGNHELVAKFITLHKHIRQMNFYHKVAFWLETIKSAERSPELSSITSTRDTLPIQAQEMSSNETPEECSTRRKAVVLPILKSKRWTRGKWATESGVGKNCVYEYLKGQRKPTDKSRKAMAEVLGLQPEGLPE
jgi:hypothetical protein